MNAFQVTRLKHFATLFTSTEQLYTLQFEPLTMMPYQYGEEISSFIKFFYENGFDKGNYFEIEPELVANYKDPSWFTGLSEEQLFLCLFFFIRRDRFVDGFLAARIEDGTVNHVIEALVKNYAPE